ncbi:MAG: hypothetical protein IT449_02500 [Phycisphaerales bacterium]|nr:hypothetical protein [Phycisphaerales bacterium]
MAKQHRNPLRPKDLSVGQLNALVTAYVAQRLSWVTHPDAWSQQTRREMIDFMSGGHPRPNPPPPPRVPDAVLSDLRKNLENPQRKDLGPTPECTDAPSQAVVAGPIRTLASREVGVRRTARGDRRRVET